MPVLPTFLLLDEVLDAFAKFGPTLTIIIRTLRGGSMQPSDFEKFIEETATAAARAEISAEFPEDGGL